ncbi:cell division protein ZapA [Psychrobacter sp. I-STPA6b]|uniref:cell division protein ZapA n=1 Tax=Psychrobacter sp. I-STPA6b TaxID=2585718 RepID=UPI001D0CA0D4|nr:cell division protein ZapA [Psychrobacter sp. I-STPA6b]
MDKTQQTKAQNDINTNASSIDTSIKKVDIMISGKTYTINCPANEEKELKDATNYINDFILDLRKQAPQLSHENLLVLCCLNLYEKIHANETAKKSQDNQDKVAESLIDKLIRDAKAML